LGQNVNSFHDLSTETPSEHKNSSGFSETFKLRSQPGARFANLLEASAIRFPNIRFRFTSPHPKDFPEDLLFTISQYNNICKYIHLPAQSGSTEMLTRMRRNHTREAYLELVARMKNQIPNLALSTDLICGFCGETE
jgi:tRNA A37 methylthiotransferase MiaB